MSAAQGKALNDALSGKASTSLASTSANGLLKKLPNSSSYFMRGDGNWTVYANNLTTSSAGTVLDARQGKVLKDYLDAGVLNEDHINLVSGVFNSGFNTPNRTGVFYMTSSESALPTGASKYGMLLQMRSPYSLHDTTAKSVMAQLYIDVNGIIYSRSWSNKAWTKWRKHDGTLLN